ncbi:ADP-dependent NAD(P)H-hydrate dehydratase (plasmid) [Coraliomargarita sp. W4R53]
MDGTWTVVDAGRSLRRPTAADDKYSRGVVGMRTGSDAYPGAAVLGVEAAWRTGVGMVRYVGPDSARGLVLARRPETVTAEGRVQAWVIGSGTDAATRGRAETYALREILAGTQPVVVDAGALDLVREAAALNVVTPHDREHERLRAMLGLGLGLGAVAGREHSALETAQALGSVVLLKGFETIVASPDGFVVKVESPTSWLATAGTGDVLAGVIGALVAAAEAAGTLVDAASLAKVAASGAWLHGRAGEAASARWGGGPVTALDVAGALPRVVAEVLAQH